MPKTVKVSTEVANALAEARVEGNKLYLSQMDRDLYVKTNKILEAIGGKWSRKDKAHVFENSPEDAIEQALATGEVTDEKVLYQFYPTPKDLADKMVILADIKKGDNVLEPSAGNGIIMKAARSHATDQSLGITCTCIELDPKHIPALKDEGFVVKHMDFLQSHGKYDRIIANPPFTKQQDIDHVNHMIDNLNPSGKLVSVMSNSITFRTNAKTKAFLERLKKFKHKIEPLPENTFQESGTNVKTVLLTLEK